MSKEHPQPACANLRVDPEGQLDRHGRGWLNRARRVGEYLGSRVGKTDLRQADRQEDKQKDISAATVKPLPKR